MRIVKKLLRNLGIFLLALLFSLGIFFLVKNPDLFQASVLNIDEIGLIKEKNRDIAYKQSEGLVDIFFSSKLKYTPVIITLAHSPSVTLDGALFSGQCTQKIIESNPEATTILLDCPKIDSNQSILLVPFSGKSEDILLEEGYYFDENTKRFLSVGNLSVSLQHSN